MKENDQIADVTWLTDERDTVLFKCTGKQMKLSTLGKRKARFVHGKPLHDKKVTAWAGMSSVGIIGPFFFDNESGGVKTEKVSAI